MIKTRFAPSPTGFLHVGGARTALYSWLFAHKARQQGQDSKFVLRIEDTDQVRSTAESAAGILTDLQWLNLNNNWDEGPTVGEQKNDFFQSMRLDLYNKHLDELLEKGLAYEAYESPRATRRPPARPPAARKKNAPSATARDMPGRQLTPQEGVKPVVRLRHALQRHHAARPHPRPRHRASRRARRHRHPQIRRFPYLPFRRRHRRSHYMGITHILIA